MSLSAIEAVRPLSVAMKEGSTTEHDAAEHSSFVSELLGGRVNERGYTDYLLRLRVVYAALEEAVRARRGDPLRPATQGLRSPLVERRHVLQHGRNEFADCAGSAGCVIDRRSTPVSR